MYTEAQKKAIQKYQKTDIGKKKTTEATRKYQKTKEGKESMVKSMRKMVFKNKYHITVEDYELMKQNQNNLCYICGKPEVTNNRNGVVRELSIDHNHSTDKVRKLLCHRCNLMIGNCYEDISILQKGIEYIKEHSDYGLVSSVGTVPFKEKDQNPATNPTI